LAKGESGLPRAAAWTCSPRHGSTVGRAASQPRCKQATGASLSRVSVGSRARFSNPEARLFVPWNRWEDESIGVYTGVAVEVGLTVGGGGPTASARQALERAIEHDSALVEAVARGDVRALEVIYERHSRGIYSLAVRLLSDGPAAEEVVQETFLKLW